VVSCERFVDVPNGFSVVEKGSIPEDNYELDHFLLILKTKEKLHSDLSGIMFAVSLRL
jgi:hypothetical protein